MLPIWIWLVGVRLGLAVGDAQLLVLRVGNLVGPDIVGSPVVIGLLVGSAVGDCVGDLVGPMLGLVDG